MPRRTLFLSVSTVLAILIVAWTRTMPASGQITNPQPAPKAGEIQAVTLIFGSKDAEAAKWDGSVSISAGQIERVAGYHFTAAHKIIDNRAWDCSTYPWANFGSGTHPNDKAQPRPTPLQPVGVTIEFRAPADAELRVKVPKGEFSFRPMDVPETEGIFPLNGLVEVYRTPVVSQLTDREFENDYPSIAADGDNLWLAWQGYRSESDRIFLRRREGGKWGERITVTEKPGDLFMTAIAVVDGKAMVFWSQHEGPDWQLRARSYRGSQAGAVETVAAKGNNLFHRAVADRQGNIHVVYQSARKGRSDIYLRSYIGSKWSTELNLSDAKRDARANDWSPSVAAASDGTVWVAWDSYAAGNYNVALRSVRQGKPGELLKVTDSTRFHAHPTLAMDAKNRLWIAWDEAPSNWGKDSGFLLSGGTPLYESRIVKVAVYAAGKWMIPRRQPEEVVPYSFRRYFQTPRLAADSAGNIWLFARPRSSVNLPMSVWAVGGKWEVFATHYSGDRWSELITLPGSEGRNEGELQVAPDRNGNIFAALVGDHRPWGGATYGAIASHNDLMFTSLRTNATAPPELSARPGEEAGGLPTEPKERQQITRLQSYTIQNAGKSYKIYRGDMHRHTDISTDGAGDGSLWDAYRYALDAAGLDFLLVTDHQSGTEEYTWWRIDKSADMFHVPGFFTGLYGTERSLSYPNGHRNLVFTKRGVHILPITPDEQKASTGPLLYPYLRSNQGIAMSHTSATTMGTDWRDNDPALEPLVEIFQGARTSAEHEGAPLSPIEKRTELHAGGYKPLGFVWNAWAKGYKLGVQASSDHISTHVSYSCILAEDSSRDALVNAMRQRHSYAATSNILMDYRMTLDERGYLQGDIAGGKSLPQLSAKIIGTGPLRKVVIVRDNQYIYSQEPSGDTFEVKYRETSLPPGEHYYYVRVEQNDGNVAWSSPIWVKKE